MAEAALTLRADAGALVASRGDVVCGRVAWVDAPPFCYASPFLADDEETAAALLAASLAHAREVGAERVRAGADAEEHAKLAAFRAAGMTTVFDFIDHVRAVRPGDGRFAELPWRRIGHAALDAARFTDVSNDTFSEVPNAPPMTVAAIAAELAAPATSRAATAAWADEDGTYVAFVHVVGGPGWASIDSIGVRAALRGRRIADTILDDVLARLDVPELRSRIASPNAASLALHRRKGFVEKRRRGVWEAVVPNV